MPIDLKIFKYTDIFLHLNAPGGKNGVFSKAAEGIKRLGFSHLKSRNTFVIYIKT